MADQPWPVASLHRGNRRSARAAGRRGRRRPRSRRLVRRDARLARRPGLPEPQHAVPRSPAAERRRRRTSRRGSRARLPDAFVRDLGANPGFGAGGQRGAAPRRGRQRVLPASATTTSRSTPTPCAMLVEELYRSNAGVVGPKLVAWDDPAVLQHVGLGLDRFGEVDPITEPGEYDQEQHDAVRDVFALPSACLLVRADLFRAARRVRPGDQLPRRRRRAVLADPPQRRPRRRRAAGPRPPPRGARGPPARPRPRRAAGPPPDAHGRHAHGRRPAAGALARDGRADARRARRRPVHRALRRGAGRRCGRSSASSRARPRCSPGAARSPSSARSPTTRSSACRTAAAPG